MVAQFTFLKMKQAILMAAIAVIASPVNACEVILPGSVRVDTTSLCGLAQVRRPEIEIGELSHDGTWMIGRVTNNMGRPARFVKIYWESLGPDRRLLDAGFVFAQPSTVMPGQNSTFKAHIPNNNGIVRTTRVEWLQ